MKSAQYLLIPGPTPIPLRVARAMDMVPIVKEPTLDDVLQADQAARQATL